VNEIKLHSKLQHPAIVKFRQAFYEGSEVMIVMDYCDGGDLQKVIKSQRGVLFGEEMIMDWFVQLISGITYLHEKRILHRDIKAQNVFLTNGTRLIQIGDFGISRRLIATNEKAHTVIGTPYYLSPEIVSNLPYGYESDIWALGCLLYELCTLRHPFSAKNLQHLALKITTGKYTPVSAIYPRDLRLLVNKMLEHDPKRRPRAAQIVRMPYVRDAMHSLKERDGLSELEPDIIESETSNPVAASVRRVAPRSDARRGRQDREKSPPTTPPPRSRDPSPQTFVDNDKPVMRNSAAMPQNKKSKEVAQVLDYLDTAGKREAIPQAAKPALNADDAKSLMDTGMYNLCPSSPPVCNLEALAVFIEDRITYKSFSKILDVLRNLPDGFDAEEIAAEIMNLIGDQNSEDIRYIWQYYSLEKQLFDTRRSKQFQDEQLDWGAGDSL